MPTRFQVFLIEEAILMAFYRILVHYPLEMWSWGLSMLIQVATDLTARKSWPKAHCGWDAATLEI